MRIALTNIVIFFAFLFLMEAACRFGPFAEPEASLKGELPLQLAPYTMLNVPSTPARDTPMQWNDKVNLKPIEAMHGRNNHGFRMDEDVSAWGQPKKKEGERIVVLTGGSAAYGVGSTSNDTTIDAYMERELNARQSQYHYRVLNFSMGSWNSFQELTGLMLYARPYDPDWVVAMNGRNDIAICCGHMQGAGNPLFYGMMRSYVNGYMAGNLHPDFYRGRLENWLTKHSAAYRKITGKLPIRREQKLIPAEYGYEIGTDVGFDDVAHQMAFYLRTEAMLADVFPRAKIVLSLQPVSDNPDTIFRKTDAEDQALTQSLDGKHLSDAAWTEFPKVLGYFFLHADRQLRAYAQTSGVGYYNMNYVLPRDAEEREAFLIDSVHLRDKGAEAVGRFYALKILATDFPEARESYEQALKTAYPQYDWPSVEPKSVK